MNKTLIISTSLLLASGCGGGSPNSGAGDPGSALPGNTADSVRYLAKVSSSTYTYGRPPEHSGVGIATYEFAEPVSASYLSTYQEIEPGCVARRVSRTESVAEKEAEDALLPDRVLVSAGEVLTIRSSQGTWFELGPSPDEPATGIYGLSSRESERGLLPADSIVYFPGDTFPLVGDVEFYSPEPLINVRLYNDDRQVEWFFNPVIPNSRITWDAPLSTSESRVHITLSKSERDESGDTDFVHVVTCNVEDTGLFEFPPAVRNVMEDEYSNPQIERVQKRFEQRGDVLISIKSRDQFEY